MSNQPEKMEIDTLTSEIFFKLSSVVGIIKTRQSWQFELVTPSGSQEILIFARSQTIFRKKLETLYS